MQLGTLSRLKPALQLREYFGSALLALAQQDERIVVLDGDLSNSNGASYIRKNIPERFFNMGIAEANLAGTAAGMAACGLIPFVTSFPSFLLCNAYDQIRLQIAMARLNVKLVGSHSGLTAAREGPPPMSIEEFALAGGLPTCAILVPSDPVSMRSAVSAALAWEGPVYIRSSREALPFLYAEDHPLMPLGKANKLRDGRDVTLLACGLMVAVVLDAAVLLQGQGIEARVLDLQSLRPIDEQAIIAAARETGALVTAEEHLIRGGMGSQVAQIVAQHQPVPIRFIGIADTYSDSGSLQELMQKHHLLPDDIARAAIQVIAARGGKVC